MTHEIHARAQPADPWKMIVRTESPDDIVACFDVLAESGRYSALEIRTEFSARPLKSWVRGTESPRVAPS